LQAYSGSNRYASVYCNQIQELPAGTDKDWYSDRQSSYENDLCGSFFGLFALSQRHTSQAFSYGVQCVREWIGRKRYTLLFFRLSCKYYSSKSTITLSCCAAEESCTSSRVPEMSSRLHVIAKVDRETLKLRFLLDR